ncbi:MAG TPA: MarR family transcriptional regulator [Acidimicrobiales bacterium]|nr:MarR family transcriptional regulator [Acidimicrobiales bacterium]
MTIEAYWPNLPTVAPEHSHDETGHDEPGRSLGEPNIPALLRSARGSYGNAVGARLAAAGFDDLPRNGPFVLGGMANHGASAADLIGALDVSKQAASQLIDVLVVRGYLTREVNPEDRRRLTIELTERGKAAAEAVRAGVDLVDAELSAAISPDQLAGLRSGLIALAEIKERQHRR